MVLGVLQAEHHLAREFPTHNPPNFGYTLTAITLVGMMAAPESTFATASSSSSSPPLILLCTWEHWLTEGREAWVGAPNKNPGQFSWADTRLFSEVCLTGSAHTAQRCWSHESNVLILKIERFNLTRWMLRSCGQRGTSLGPPWTRCSRRSPPLTENPGMFVALLLRNCRNSMADNVVLGQNRTLLFLPF